MRAAILPAPLANSRHVMAMPRPPACLSYFAWTATEVGDTPVISLLAFKSSTGRSISGKIGHRIEPTQIPQTPCDFGWQLALAPGPFCFKLQEQGASLRFA